MMHIPPLCLVPYRRRGVRWNRFRHAAFGAAASLLTMLSSPLLPAQSDANWWDGHEWPGLGGIAFATLVRGSEIIAGGDILQADGHTLQHIARFDGLRWHPMAGGTDNAVWALAEYQGEVIAAGDFTAAGGTPASGIARWNGTRWASLGLGLELSHANQPSVHALAVFQGELYATGQFDTAGGAPALNIARWNGTRWAPVGSGLTQPFAEPGGWCLLASANVLYVGGRFETAGGVPSPALAAWDGSRWSSVGGGITGGQQVNVNALAEFQGSLHVGGDFFGVGPVNARRIARFDGSAWHTLGTGIQDWEIAAEVLSLHVHDGVLWVGGDFITAGNTPASRVARWNGSQWSGVGGIDGAVLHYRNRVWTLGSYAGRLLAGGEFDRAGTDLTPGHPTVSRSLVTFDGTRWSGLSAGRGLSNDVFSLTTWRDGYVATGRFHEAGGSYTTEVAYFDGYDFQHLGAFDHLVHDAVVFGTDLVVTGDFLRIDGRPARYVARWDGTRWSAMGNGAGGLCLAVYQGQLYAAGAAYAVGMPGTPSRWNGTAWEQLPGAPAGTFEDLHVHNGLLYFAGTITTGPSANLVAFDGTAFRAVGGGRDGTVTALATWNNQLAVGGRFTGRICLWNGTSFAAFPAALPGSGVLALANWRGQLVVGGDFRTSQGMPSDYVARFDGTAWRGFGTGLSSAPLAILADDARGRVTFGGTFGRAGGKPSWYLAEWNDQPRWSDLGYALPGGRGAPVLVGLGLLPSGSIRLDLERGPANSAGLLFLGGAPVQLPVLGGTFVPAPQIFLPVATDAAGASRLTLPVPPLPPGLRILAQAWLVDGGGPQGASASSALSSL